MHGLCFDLFTLSLYAPMNQPADEKETRNAPVNPMLSCHDAERHSYTQNPKASGGYTANAMYTLCSRPWCWHK